MEPIAIVPEERQRFNKRLRRLALLVLLIVIGAHALVGVGAAFYVVAKYFTKPKAVFVAARQEVEMQPEKRKHREQMEKLESMRPKPTVNNRIQSLKPTALMLPNLPKVPVNTDIPLDATLVPNDKIDGLGSSAMGNGSGLGNGFLGGLGGMKITKLGVLLDVSGSTQKFLEPMLQEIDKNFKGMPIVFANGCGNKTIGDSKKKKGAVNPRDYEIIAAPKLEKEIAGGSYQEFNQVNSTRKKNPEVDAYMAQAMKQPNIFWMLKTKGDKKDANAGTQFALIFLSTQGVDTIYWFTDLRDQFDEESAKRVIGKLKSRNIRLVIHDFADPDAAAAEKNAPGYKAFKNYIAATGGSFIFGLPEGADKAKKPSAKKPPAKKPPAAKPPAKQGAQPGAGT